MPASVADKAQSVLEKLKSQFKLEPVPKKDAMTGEAVFNTELVVNEIMPESSYVLRQVINYVICCYN